MIALAVFLTIAELVLLAAVVLGAIAFVGLIIYDAFASRQEPRPETPKLQPAYSTEVRAA